MSKKLWTLLLAPILALGLALPAWSASSSELQQEIQMLKQRLDDLEYKLQQEKKESAKEAKVDEDHIRQLAKEVVSKDSPIHVGGALRTQYQYKDYSDPQDEKGGDFNFDTFRLNLDGEIGDLILSAEYRFYPNDGLGDSWHAIHHGYVGYNFTDSIQGQIGVHQAPFGIQPFASHNFWFSGAYYVGLEDDYDMGLKFLYDQGLSGCGPGLLQKCRAG